ncbi:MAG: transposase [Deltaproteobacteria bacterium]|nr:transposase [Deltaproteobacteria bacterium]MBW2071851.1 transposase [Deltaproteobacteria bacterium]
MARQLRIEYEGAYYHVLSRGNKQQAIFLSDHDRKTFIKTLVRMSERFELDIIAFVLMDNHYHVLLRTNRANLSKAMQWLGTTYTTIFNLRHSQKGHLFQGRFKSILVENEPYLMQLSCYIHRNPLRAGMVQRLIHYPWSSYPGYAYKRLCPDWVKADLILSLLGPDGTRRKAYREKVQQYANEKKSIWEEVKHGVIYGSQAFVDRIKKDYLNKEAMADISVQKRIVNDTNLGEIIEMVSTIPGVDLEKWKSCRRISKSAAIDRDMLVYHLWRSGRFRNSEIGSLTGLSISSVSRRAGIFQSRLEQDKRLRARYDKFKAIIKV